MNVGVVGLGKLGLPILFALGRHAVGEKIGRVYGYDVRTPDLGWASDQERGFTEAMVEARADVEIVTRLADLVAECEVIFVAVQTPHEWRFEGVTPLPDDRADFDYAFLREAVHEIEVEATSQLLHPTIAVISTVLPGTMAREIEPILHSCDLAYNPSFIAMGTTIEDFLNPEFVLIGSDRGYFPVADVYDALGLRPAIVNVSIANAELIKVLYNTFIGQKIAFANTAMELCEKIPDCDVDVVTGALALSDRRLISAAYLRGGMGDGGACHPRDNIALSWLARELDLSFDLFEAMMMQRECQSYWLGTLLGEQCQRTGLSPGILGLAYKPGSAIVTGSPALLLFNQLREAGADVAVFDPHTGENAALDEPRVWLVGCDHPDFPVELSPGSVVIDPWRTWPDQDGVTVMRLGSARDTVRV